MMIVSIKSESNDAILLPCCECILYFPFAVSDYENTPKQPNTEYQEP